MKTVQKIITVLILLSVSYSCMDEYFEEITANIPVYLGYEEFRNAVVQTNASDLENPGKIYFKDNYIFINEEYKGIHIIDNTDPEDPQNIAFIEIPGNLDMAIKDNILFADSYIDLVALDISDLDNIHEVERIEEVFPYSVPTYNEKYAVAAVDNTKGVVVDWTLKKYRQKMDTESHWVYYGGRDEYNSADYGGFTLSNSGGAGSSFGIGGSMARFGLYDNYLYTVTENKMFVFDAEEPASVSEVSTQNLNSGVETMFIYDAHMFLGTQSSMLIYSLATSPGYVGTFSHVTSCDPVIVSDGYAYITLHDGNRCGNDVNRLDVVKLSEDYLHNSLVESYNMHNPHGLGIDDQILFICDGDAGLKVYDATDKLHIDDHQIASFPNINTYDVIPVNNYLFMIGDDGFYQYDYSDLQNIYQVSFIPVVNQE
jgi:hypothetical protein